MTPDLLKVRAFGPQFYRVPAYWQASALLLQKLMKTLDDDWEKINIYCS